MPKRFTLAGGLAVAAVVFFSYYPSFAHNFHGEVWNALEVAARLTLPQYIVRTFDPRVQTMEYRPVFILLFGGEFFVFRFNPLGYHLVKTLFHLVNTLLLMALVWRISSKRRLAFVSALVYAGLPIYSEALFNLVDMQPEATLFYLLSALCWTYYLHDQTWRYFFWAAVTFALALLTKETSITLIVTLFLLDRLLVPNEADLSTLTKRYAPFVGILLIYSIFEYIVQKTGGFGNLLGYGIGPHAFDIFINYFGWLIFPWSIAMSNQAVWMAIVVVVFLIALVRRPTAALAFLGIETLVLLAPYLWSPPELITPRYLYQPAMIVAVVIALLADWAGAKLHGRALAWIAPALIGLILLANLSGVSAAAEGLGGLIKWSQAPFRDAARRHPTLPDGAFLYFINPLYPRDLRGLTLARYGPDVVFGTSVDDPILNVTLFPLLERVGVPAPTRGMGLQQIAGLRDHPLTFVYFSDADGKATEMSVQRDAPTTATPALPVTFSSIQLEEYEITANTLNADDTLVLFLYWHALQPVDRNYTVFAHLLDHNGQIVEGYDSPPREGSAPTGAWKPGARVVDYVLIPMAHVPRGADYRVEIGLYYLPTLERLPVVDAQGQPVTDHVTIASFRVE